MRLNKPTFCRIMAHEIIEKRRRKIRTPRATQPVLARMPPRSIKRTAASTRIVLSPQFQRKFLPLQHRSTRVPRNQSKLAKRCCRFDGSNVARRVVNDLVFNASRGGSTAAPAKSVIATCVRLTLDDG